MILEIKGRQMAEWDERKMKKIPKLTELEIKIMKVLWEHEAGLTIQEIAGYLTEEKISAPSVSQAMQRMVKKEAVKVTDYVLVVSSYTRVFVPAFSREEFMAAEIGRLDRSLWGRGKSNASNVTTALMGFLKEKSGDGISMEDMKKFRQMIDQFIQEGQDKK